YTVKSGSWRQLPVHEEIGGILLVYAYRTRNSVIQDGKIHPHINLPGSFPFQFGIGQFSTLEAKNRLVSKTVTYPLYPSLGLIGIDTGVSHITIACPKLQFLKKLLTGHKRLIIHYPGKGHGRKQAIFISLGEPGRTIHPAGDRKHVLVQKGIIYPKHIRFKGPLIQERAPAGGFFRGAEIGIPLLLKRESPHSNGRTKTFHRLYAVQAGGPYVIGIPKPPVEVDEVFEKDIVGAVIRDARGGGLPGVSTPFIKGKVRSKIEPITQPFNNVQLSINVGDDSRPVSSVNK